MFIIYTSLWLIKKKNSNNINEEINVLPIDDTSLALDSVWHCHYYDNVSTRYVYVSANIYNVEGYRFDTVNGMGSVYSTYPARVVTTYSYTKSSNAKKLTVKYYYKRLLSSILESTGYYSATVTFTAGEDVWG